MQCDQLQIFKGYTDYEFVDILHSSELAGYLCYAGGYSYFNVKVKRADSHQVVYTAFQIKVGNNNTKIELLQFPIFMYRKSIK